MVSVCIATYNGEAFILSQLRSILPQLQEEDEIVISDDNSKDGTLDAIASLGDKRIRIVKGPATGSPIDNFENALRQAKGDFIFLSDQDDQWLPGKAEACVAKLNEGYECVMTDCSVTDEYLNVAHPSFFKINGTRENRYYNLLLKNGYVGGCMAFTKRLKEKCLPFPNNIPMHDIWIGNVAAFYFKSICFIHQPYSYFRRTGNNASTSGAKSRNSIKRRFLYRWYVSCEIFHLISQSSHKSNV